MSATPSTTGSVQADAKGNPIYRKNPHPTQAYRITMKIEDAPGPFEDVSGVVFYDIKNHKQCTPMQKFEVAWDKPSEDIIPPASSGYCC